MPAHSKALTREALYEQVWSEPMIHVAKRLGLSDRGLAKLCARHEIPVPPRGWWAKKQHGHRVRHPGLPPAKKPGQDRIEIQKVGSVDAAVDAIELRREKDPE